MIEFEYKSIEKLSDDKTIVTVELNENRWNFEKNFSKAEEFSIITKNTITYDLRRVINDIENKQLTIDYKQPFLNGKKKIMLVYNAISNSLGNESQQGCSHVWQKYNGLTRTYLYCVSCDEKRED